MSRYMQSEIDRLTGTVEALEAKLERAEGQVRAMREDAKRALNGAFDQRDAALAAGNAMAEVLADHAGAGRGEPENRRKCRAVAEWRRASGRSEPR